MSDHDDEAVRFRTAIERYRQHISVLDTGPATQENFSRSPYYRGREEFPSPWFWDDWILREDQSLLARECVAFYEGCEE